MPRARPIPSAGPSSVLPGLFARAFALCIAPALIIAGGCGRGEPPPSASPSPAGSTALAGRDVTPAPAPRADASPRPPERPASASAAPASAPAPAQASVTPPAPPPAAPPRELDRPDANLLIISLTNLRADHLGAYGCSRPTSPRLDALAAESVVFERAFSHASWTLPVAVSLLTSQYPFTHGLMNRRNFTPLPRGVATFVDVLRSAGYVTAAFVGDRDYSAAFGHTTRFNYLYDSVDSREDEDWHRHGVLARTVPRAISWLRQNKDRKFFAFVQGYDVHCPFAVPVENAVFDPSYQGEIDFTRCWWTFGKTTPVKVGPEGQTREMYVLKTNPEEGEDYEALFQEEDVRHMIALYDGEIANADRQVGALLDEVKALGLLDKTIIIFLSEHGDMMGKHGRFMRGGPLRGTFYDDVIRVPLFIRHPGLGPSRIAGLAQLVDLAPTILDMLGLPRPESFVGKSLRPLILDGTPVNPRIFAGSAYSPKKTSAYFRDASVVVAVRDLEWKLIRERLYLEGGPEDSYELFHVSRDPDELENVAPANAAAVADLERVIDGWLRDIGASNVIEELKR